MKFTKPRTYRAHTTAKTVRRQYDLNPRQKRAVRALIKNSGEVNHHDITVAYATDIGASLDLIDMTGISQGDADGERVGDRLFPKSLRWDLMVNAGGASSSATVQGIVRTLVIRWKPDTQNEALTTATQIFEVAHANSLYLADATERKKFEILHDKTYKISGNTANPNYSHYLNDSIKLADKPVIYNEGLTTGSNKIYFAVIGSSFSANTVEYGGHLRLKYTD